MPRTRAQPRLPRSAILPLSGLLGVLVLGLLLWKAGLLGGSRPSLESANFPLTAFVHGEAGPQDLVLRSQGFVLLDLGTERRREPIGDKGQVFFPEIPASFRGRSVNVALDAGDYELVDPQPRRLDGPSLYLPVRRKPGRITGRVQYEAGHPVSGASVDVAGLSTTTDSTGRFELTIPADRLQPELVLQVVAKGYEPWHVSVVPGSNEMTATLQRP